MLNFFEQMHRAFPGFQRSARIAVGEQKIRGIISVKSRPVDHGASSGGGTFDPFLSRQAIDGFVLLNNIGFIADFKGAADFRNPAQFRDFTGRIFLPFSVKKIDAAGPRIER